MLTSLLQHEKKRGGWGYTCALSKSYTEILLQLMEIAARRTSQAEKSLDAGTDKGSQKLP